MLSNLRKDAHPINPFSLVTAMFSASLHNTVAAMLPGLIAIRRDLHRYPESSWKEYRTASRTARRLLELGFQLTLGPDALQAKARRTPPDPESCARERRRAVREGADAELVARMGDGFTGFWADLACPGPSPTDNDTTGPLVALRFDMDANELTEAASPDHRPAREGFSSCHSDTMHACGHDGHTTIGLGVAEVLHSLRHQMNGTVRLIFQPAEEDGLGAAPMVAAGAVEGVQRLFGLHLGMQATENGQIVCGTRHFLATTTFRMHFSGRAAHAGMVPHEGRNALLAACTAVQNMHAIPRHGDGASRINIGQFLAGDASTNIIPAQAELLGETRGLTSAIDAYMMEEVTRMSQAAADMWGCTRHLTRISHCPSASSSPELIDSVENIARTMPCFTDIRRTADFWASEDFAFFMERVQENGGQAVHIQLGTRLPSGHHTDHFDFDETALAAGVELLSRLVLESLHI